MTTLQAVLPEPEGPEAELWPLLFDLARDVPEGWAVIGAQMVILHAAAHGAARPVRTRDTDLLVDLRSLRPREIVRWLRRRGFTLVGVDSNGVGHEFRRGGLAIDVLASDRSGPRADRITEPPARTVEVPGGRNAANRLATVAVTVGKTNGELPIPDWIGALILKARAAREVDGRDTHLRDFALLLGLPVDVFALASRLRARERTQLQRAVDLLDDGIWQDVSGSVNPETGRAAARLVGRAA